MSAPRESPERALLRRLLKQSHAAVISVASDGSAVLRLGAVVVVSSGDMQVISDLLQ